MSDAAPIEIEYRPLGELVPYVRNARTHTPGQIEKMKASLARYGWTNPMLVAQGTMIAGHARLTAALQMAEAGQPIARNPDPWSGPTVDLSHLSVTERRAYVLTDNRLAEEAVWDFAILRTEFADLTTDGFDLSLTAFDLPEIDTIIHGWEPDFDKIGKTTAGLTDLDALVKVRCRQADVDKVVYRIKEVIADIEGARVDD